MLKRRWPKGKVVTPEEKPYSELELAFLEFMKGKTAQDLLPEKTKSAYEDLKRAGLIP